MSGPRASGSQTCKPSFALLHHEVAPRADKSIRVHERHDTATAKPSGRVSAGSEDKIRIRDHWVMSQPVAISQPIPSQTRRSQSIAHPSHRAASHPIAAVSPRFAHKSVHDKTSSKCRSSAARQITACYGCRTVSTMARASLSRKRLPSLPAARQFRRVASRGRRRGPRPWPIRRRQRRARRPGDRAPPKARAPAWSEALTGRGEPLGEAAFSIGGDGARSRRQFRLAAGNPQSGGAHRDRRRAVGRRRRISSTGARNGIVSASSRANRARRRNRYSRLSIMCSARYRPMPTSSRPAKAMSPTPIHSLIEQKVSTIVLADIGKLVAGTQEELETWLKSGGVLIRFAGPRLEQGGDELLPVALRRGGRSLGGSLSWSTPQPLAPFEEKSPFRGLTVPEDVKINRQVLADPTVASESEVWATLADGTPLVTASKQGQGFIVLFHVTANSDWSNLPAVGPVRRNAAPRRGARPEPGHHRHRQAGRQRRGLALRVNYAGCFHERATAASDARRLRPARLAAAARGAHRSRQARHAGSGPRSSARLLRPLGCGARLQPHHRQDRAQAARQRSRDRARSAATP